MYSVYIKNYLNSSKTSIVSSEASVYSIPISQGNENRVFMDPGIKTEMGKAGSMDFSIRPNHSYYDLLQQMKTIIRVDFEDTTLFRGRVLTIDDSHFSGDRKIHLEGDMAFLMDSQLAGVKEENRPEITILQYLTNVINEHNTQMRENGEEDKTFELGEVPGKYSSNTNSAQQISVANDKFGSDSWRRTMDAIEDLRKKYGGYFRTRFIPANRSSDGREHHYLDWLQAYFSKNVNSQSMQVASNMIDINSTTEVDNLFTVFIPIGDNNGEPLYVQEYTPPGHAKRTKKTITVPELLDFCTDAQLSKGYHQKAEYRDAIKQYGTIYKAQSFSNAKTQDVLWSYAIDWMLNNYIGGIRNFTVSALDLHHIEPAKQKYLTGDRVNVIYPNGGNGTRDSKELTILSAQYKLHTPDKNSYSVGIPSDLLSKEYGHASKSNKKSTEKEQPIPQHNGPPPTDDDIYSVIDEYKQNAYNYIVNHRYNNDIYAQLMAEDPKKAERAMISTQISIVEGFLASDARPTSGTHKKRVQKIMMDGMKGSLTINGPIDHSHDYTDEEVAAINAYNNFAIIDATKQEFGIAAVMDLLSPEVPRKVPNMLLQMATNKNKGASVKIWDNTKVTDANAKETLSLDGFLGKAAGKVFGAGKDGTGDLLTTVMNGIDAEITTVPPSKAGSTNKTDLTTKISGFLGEMSSKYQTTGIGFDSLGNVLSTIKQDGPAAVLSLMGIGNAGSTQEADKTVELSGGDGTPGADGKVKTGRKEDTGWRITLNEPLTYTDDEGTAHTFAKGFVFAEDVQLDGFEKISSLKSNVIVTGNLIAKKIEAEYIDAEKAYVDDLKSGKIVANRSLWVSKGFFTELTSESVYSNYIYYKETGMSALNIMSKIIAAWNMSESNGTIKLQGKPMNAQSGNWVDLASFNMAATNFYKNAVAAATNNGLRDGRNSIYGYGYSTPLNPGGSTTVTLGYDNPVSGARVPIGKSYTITANAASVTDLGIYSGSTKVSSITENGTYTAKVTVDGLTNTSSNVSVNVPSSGAEDISLWDGTGSNASRWTGSNTISSTVNVYAYAKVNGSWVEGAHASFTPSGGGGSHSISVGGLIGPMNTETAIKAELPNSTTKVSPDTKGKWYGVEVSCGSSSKGIYWKTPS